MLIKAKYLHVLEIFRRTYCWFFLFFAALLYVADKGLLYKVFPLVLACSLITFVIDRSFLSMIARSWIIRAFFMFSAYMLLREMGSPGMDWDSFPREVRTWFRVLVFLLAIAYICRQISNLNRLFWVLVAASFLGSAIIIFDHFVNIVEYTKVSGYQIGHNSHFFWHTFFGGAYAIVVIICLYLWTTSSQRYLLVLISLVTAYSTFMVFLSQSRGAMFSLLLCVCFLIFMHKRRLVAPLLAFLALIVILAIIGKVFLYDPATLLARKDAGRFALWGHAITQINEAPLFGGGLSAEYAYDMPGYKVLDKPHNLLLTVGIAGGYIGISLFLLVFCIAFRIVWLKRSHPAGGIIAALLLFSFTFHMFDTMRIFYRPTIDWVLLWLPVGLAIALEIADGAENLSNRTISTPPIEEAAI